MTTSPLAATLTAFADTPALNRWIYSKLAPHIRGDVLEIGSGIGNFSALVLENARHLVVSDVEPPFLDLLRRRFAEDRRVTVAPYDLADAPPAEIASRSFDTILAMNVLEHLADDRAAVAALAQRLAPGGKLLVYVPACPFAYGSLDRALGHFRRYTPAALTSLLASGDLRPSPPTYVNLVGLAGWLASGRLLRRTQLAPWQLSLFERLLPIVRLEDHLRLPIGLGLYAHASR